MHEPEKISSAEWRGIMRQSTIRQIWGTKDEDEPEQFASRVYSAKFYFVSEDYSGFLYIVQADTIHAAPLRCSGIAGHSMSFAATNSWPRGGAFISDLARLTGQISAGSRSQAVWSPD